MKFHLMTQGGYGKIYKEPTRTTICKRIPKRDSQHLDVYSTIVELATTSSIQCIPGTPRVRCFELTTNSAMIYMHHHGEPLSKWLDKLHPVMRTVDGPRALRSVIFTLLHLYSMGILHTDLKPCNILVKDDPSHTTLIDYNCVSVAGVEYDTEGPHAAATGGAPLRVSYASAVGTFSFLAPELVFTGRPSPTSCVWSLALLALLIYADTYPIPVELTHTAEGQWHNTAKDWKQIHRTLQSNGSPVLTIPKSTLEAFGNDYQVLAWVQQALAWEPLARPTLPDIAKIMLGDRVPAYPLPVIEPMADPTMVTRDMRITMLNHLYNIAVETRRQTWFALAVYIFDVALTYIGRREQRPFAPNEDAKHDAKQDAKQRAPPPLNENGLSVLAAACWVMSGCFHNEHVFDEPMHMECLRATFKANDCITQEHISHRLWMLGTALEWQVWARPLDVVLYEDYRIKLTFAELRDVFARIDRPWTPKVLAVHIALSEAKVV